MIFYDLTTVFNDKKLIKMVIGSIPTLFVLFQTEPIDRAFVKKSCYVTKHHNFEDISFSVKKTILVVHNFCYLMPLADVLGAKVCGSFFQ